MSVFNPCCLEEMMIPKIANILYATGMGSGTPHAFRYALSVAQKYDAKIHLLHSHENLSSSAQSMVNLYLGADVAEKNLIGVLEAAEKKIVERLEQLCAQETASDPHGAERIASIKISRLPPKQAILEEANKLKVDLIIMGSHRHTVLSNAMLGSTTLKVLHASTKIPVLVVPIPEGYDTEGL